MSREQFEAWFKSDFHPDKTGPYLKETLFFAWQAASKASEQQLAALVAENAGLKNAVDIIETKYMNWEGLSDAFSDARGIKTPATDDFLAEVRARGVESAINTVIAMMNHQHPVTSKAIDILRVHAAQLRKGAAL